MAQVVQWIAYLLFGIASGFCWLPLAELISPSASFREWTWAGGTGLTFALTFRSVASLFKEEPSGWFVFAFPPVAAVARIGANAATGIPGEFGEYVLQDSVTIWISGSTCFGLFVLPLAAVHLAILRLVHRRLSTWGLCATRRQANRGMYALVGFFLIVATEGPRILAMEVAARVPDSPPSSLSVYGLDFPRGCEVIDPYNVAGAARHTFWIRCDGPLKVPAELESRPVTAPEPDAAIVGRALAHANPTLSQHGPKVTQIKWSDHGTDVRANLVRVAGTEYVELIRR
jgi:hypothetical protein